MQKLRVGIIFGGKSCEHEISLLSAKNIIEALDPAKYETVLIGIDKRGGWHLQPSSGTLPDYADTGKILPEKAGEHIAIVPCRKQETLLYTDSLRKGTNIDVAFPVLHGTYGEDGTIQGLLKIADIPFVGAGVLGSAIGMDKDVVKRLLRDAGINIAKFFTMKKSERQRFDYDQTVALLGSPFFIKPANAGSSVGVSKVRSRTEFEAAVTSAFLYDKKIVLEEYIEGREIECSVLGNEHPIASLPGEIVPTHEFYSYEAKYLDKEGAVLHAPADLNPKTIEEIQKMAVTVFEVLCCEGMARVDFFLEPSGRIVVNEINTIPGFTSISMYPKLWQTSNISYSELLDRLIALALERHREDLEIETHYTASLTLNP